MLHGARYRIQTRFVFFRVIFPGTRFAYILDCDPFNPEVCAVPTTVPFDTHAFVKELRTADFSEEQAEAQAMALSKALDTFPEVQISSLATRQDLRELELRRTL